MIDIITLAAARKFTSITAEELEEKIKDLSVFQLKGTKATVDELPLTGEVGDVWHVQEDSNEYVWINQHWESFGGLVNFLVDDSTIELVDGTLKVKDSGITAIQLQNNTVTTAKIAPRAIDGLKLAEGCVGISHISPELKQLITTKPTINGVTLSGNLTSSDLKLQGEPLIFTNILATFSLNSDTGYEDYNYKAILTCPDVTASMLATVIFSEEQAASGNYALTCVTGTNSVTIYSNDDTSIVVPTVIAGAPVEVQDSIRSDTVSNIWTGTQVEYNAITTKDSNTLYFIVEANS